MSARKKSSMKIVALIFGVSFFSLNALFSKELMPFPHHIHNKLNLGCKTCHGGIYKSARAADDNIPHPDSCFDCHDKNTAQNTLFRASQSKVEFNHKLHITELEVPCATCHKYLDAEKLESGDAMPRKKTCNTCHAKNKKLKECSLCHKDKPVFSHINHRENEIQCTICHKKIKSSKSPLDNNLPDQKMCDECHEPKYRAIVKQNNSTVPNIYFNHKLHGEDIDLKCLYCHRTIYKRYMKYGEGLPGKAKCMKCHKTGRISHCNICHNKTAGQPLSHKANWKLIHKFKVKNVKQDCQGCHKFLKKCTAKECAAFCH
jgi:hypothetical protein